VIRITLALSCSLLVLAACNNEPRQGEEGDASYVSDTSDAISIDVPYIGEDAVEEDANDVGSADISVDIPSDTAVDTAVDTTPDTAPDAEFDTGPNPNCEEGETTCIGGRLATCLEGSVWLAEDCPEATVCEAGECLGPDCEIGERLCAEDRIIICAEDGSGWQEEPCATGELCFFGECVECVNDDQCNDGQVCDTGTCVAPELFIVTEIVAAGAVESAYDFAFEAEGGTTPYAWLIGGDVPGLSLADDGTLSGTPTTPGTYDFTVTVDDSGGQSASGEFSLTVRGPGLVILTESIPEYDEGTPIDFALSAAGGDAPYGWFIIAGAPPAGVDLTSSGVLRGTPTEVGPFPMTFRVVDTASPPDFAEAELTLTITIAPLRIVGDQAIDLFITSVVILPLMTSIEGIPIPYSTELQATGGLRPRTWVENDLPGGIGALLGGDGGIPEGLSLSADGVLSGSVTDTSQVLSVSIPFTGIELQGFFFVAEVSDSQDPPATDSAVFLIPTIPIGG
jgi:hypothetical protein